MANNHDLEQWPEREKTAAESSSRRRRVSADRRREQSLCRAEAANDDDLNRMLPAKLAPPRTPEGTASCSCSTSRRRWKARRCSSRGSPRRARRQPARIDRVGVLAFDNSFQWAIPIRRNEAPGRDQAADHGHHRRRRHTDRARAARGVSPDSALEGDLQAHPAADRRHLRGRRQHGACARGGQQKVTISTIGLGQDVNRAYLERVAQTAEGKSYFVIDASRLAQVVLRDVIEHTGSSVMEKPVPPEVVSRPKFSKAST